MPRWVCAGGLEPYSALPVSTSRAVLFLHSALFALLGPRSGRQGTQSMIVAGEIAGKVSHALKQRLADSFRINLI
jgi:hypothetical protein